MARLFNREYQTQLSPASHFDIYFLNKIRRSPNMAYLPKPLAAASFLAAILLLLIHFSNAQHYQVDLANSPAPSPQPQVIDCNGACKGRCEKSKRPNLCNRSCGSCCTRCNCVPHGTSGNYEDCPCYFNLTTHNNTRKCP